MINGSPLWCRHTNPLRLHVELVQEQNVGLVNRCGGSGLFLELIDSADMINMSMRANDLFQGESMLLETGKDDVRVIPGIDDNRFSRLLIAQNGAVACQHTDSE